MSKDKDIVDTQETMDFFADEGVSTERAKNVKATTRRFIKDLMKQKWKLFIIFISIIASSMFTIFTPKLLGKAINQIYDGVTHAMNTGTAFQVNMKTMGGIVGLIAVFYLLSTLFSYIQQYVMSSVSQNLALSMRKSVSRKMNKLPLRYYDEHKKGDILSRVTSDIERVADTLQEGISQLISSVVTIVGAFIMMFLISPTLTLIAFITIVISMCVAGVISKRTNSYYAANQSALGELNANIEEAFTGNNLIKAFNLQKAMIKINDELNEKLREKSTKAQFITYAINPIVRFLGQVGYGLIAIQGAWSVINGAISIGDIQAVFQYVNQVSEPVTQLAYTLNSLQGALASAERVYQMQDEIEEVADVTKSTLIPQPKGDVVFEHTKFGYSEDKVLMNDINIEVKSGSKIAIVGPTGAGKTTLVNLLMRFYEVQEGNIFIDGIDIKNMSRQELRTILGMVLQDTWLFNGTVAENISYGRSNATQLEIEQAAKSARIDHFIRTLPQGYDTILDDEHVNMSVGQKQLLTIARAILSDPAILILDEATSSVDTRTEIEIQHAMDTLMKSRTSFVIAHRLSTIKDADIILFMRDGTIVEQGSHDELIYKGGYYADLYNSQFTIGNLRT